jgi:hypothetical protein
VFHRASSQIGNCDDIRSSSLGEALTSFGSVRFPPACLTSQNNSGGRSIIPKKPKAVVTAGAGHVASLKFLYSIAMLRPARTPQGQTERISGYLAPTTDNQLATTLSTRPGPSIRSRDSRDLHL